MKIRVPSYYKKFKCIASACEDTCCAGWDVVIDDETYERYEKLEGSFGDRLRSKMIVDEDGEHIFVLDGDRCPFLDQHNLCDIHKEVGEQYLCYTCEQYPRYTEEFGDLKEMGISLSCPEAARIIFRNEIPVIYEFIEDEQLGQKVHDEDEAILEDFFRCRETIFNIIENPETSLGIAASVVLKFIEELQDRLDFDEIEALDEIIKRYNCPKEISKIVDTLSAYPINDEDMYEDVLVYFKTYRDLVHINGNDPLGINKVLSTYWHSEDVRATYTESHKRFQLFYEEKRVNFKKILLYFIYRYFMKSFYDFDMSSKIKVAIMSTIMIKELAVFRLQENGIFSDADMVDISHSYSKDVEHLVVNVETLERIFETEEVYDIDRIVNTLLKEFS